MKDASSTDVIVHRGEALSSFYFCGDLYRIDLSTGATLGKQTWGGAIPDWGVSAHTKVDPATGELVAFVGSTGVELIAGLGYWAGTVYGFDYQGKLYAIDPTTAATTELPSTGVPAGTHFWGAAVTTLAPLD